MRWKDFLELHVNLTTDEEIACILWTRPDVYEKAEEEYPDVVMTDEIADEVLSRMDHTSDCENGMTWDSLEYHLEVVLNEMGLIS
jgi:DNA-binding transcriptional ArsR family regulator